MEMDLLNLKNQSYNKTFNKSQLQYFDNAKLNIF